VHRNGSERLVLSSGTSTDVRHNIWSCREISRQGHPRSLHCCAVSFPAFSGRMQESRSTTGSKQPQAATCILRSDLLLKTHGCLGPRPLVRNGSLPILWCTFGLKTTNQHSMFANMIREFLKLQLQWLLARVCCLGPLVAISSQPVASLP